MEEIKIKIIEQKEYPIVQIPNEIEGIDVDNIEFIEIEDEWDKVWTRFIDISKKPFPFKILMDVYKQLGINLDENPRLKEIVMAKKS